MTQAGARGSFFATAALLQMMIIRSSHGMSFLLLSMILIGVRGLVMIKAGHLWVLVGK